MTKGHGSKNSQRTDENPPLLTDGGKDDAKVVGHNTDSGDTVGVWGEVDSGDGYGLATDDDVKVGGTVDAGAEWRVEAEDGDGDTGNVVVGDPSNDAYSGASGATVAGGTGNTASDDRATVGGGWNNTASAANTTTAGGKGNTASQNYATVSGGNGHTASGNSSVVGGGTDNIASGAQATVSGGFDNEASGYGAVVGGGDSNEALGELATIAGGGPTDLGDRAGTKNVVYDDYGTIGGGGNNRAGNDAKTAEYATVSGGQKNTANEEHATVAGGHDNTASGVGAVVAGGEDNDASGDKAMVLGGDSNIASGNRSFAAGTNADTNDKDGTFVWGDSTAAATTAEAKDQFLVGAAGGAKIYTDGKQSTGSKLPAGSGSWSSLSSAAVKSNVSAVDPQDVLEGVENLDVATWEYDSQDGVAHMGPMAEDFHDAFGLGETADRISTVDADGVALAAIQGLVERLEAENEALREELAERDDEITALKAQNEALSARLETVEAAVSADVSPVDD